MFRSRISLFLLTGLLTSLIAGAAQAQSFNCFIPQDRVDSLLADLANVTNLTEELGCRKDEPCIVKAVLDQVAKEKGIPAELFYVVAWTESNWQQWDNRGRTVRSGTSDFGLMQINKRAHGHKYDWTQITGDALYNARAGADILKWSYNYARRKGYRGHDLWKATYAVYNGGPRAVHRPWQTNSRYRLHDTNFARHLSGKPWVSRTRNCGPISRPVVTRPTQPSQPSQPTQPVQPTRPSTDPTPWLTPSRPARTASIWNILSFLLWA